MADSFFTRLRSIFPWERFAIGAILLSGFVLRLRQYLTGRSLWLDEAMLALNIVNRNFAGLTRPLDYEQGSPIGFLFVEKLLNLSFGDHELVFRLFPFIAGFVALYLFYLLLRRTTSGLGLLAGLALFAFGPELVYYSSEVKQYILDVAVTIFLLLLAIPILEGHTEKRNYVYLGLAGIFSLWFSHPALFVLAGIGIGLFLQALDQRERGQVSSVLLVGISWLLSFGLLYFISLQSLSHDEFLLAYWQENFMPVPPWSDWNWFPQIFRGLIQNQVGMYAPAWFAFMLSILGFTFLFRKNKAYAGALFVIPVFSLVAAGLRVYPLGGRLSLFLVPLIILLTGQAIHTLQYGLGLPNKLGMFLALLVSVFLLYEPVAESISNFINPKYFENIRPSMATLSENWKNGDVLFVSNGAVPAFRFYAERYGLGNVAFQTSEASDYQNPENIVKRLQNLSGSPRVWILITHVYETRDFNEKEFLLVSLDAMGKLKREFRSPGTSVYLFLYDLSPQAGKVSQ